VVSIFYLIPQMVGAGVLVQPLLGLPHYVGVIIVGIVVTLIVATAGMASTTYVQFMKGGLLLICSTILVFGILGRGLSTDPDQGGTKDYHNFQTLQANVAADGTLLLSDASYSAPADWQGGHYGEAGFVKLTKEGVETIWQVKQATAGYTLEETLFVTTLADGTKLYNGANKEEGKFFPVGHIKELKVDGVEVAETGAVGPFAFLRAVKESTVVLWGKQYIKNEDGGKTLIYYQKPTTGTRILRPGLKFKVDNASGTDKFNFISLMLALFCGTAALPHILIRYYTVPSQAAARKSTLVAIASIGFFYMLTLFMGIGAMTNGVINLTDNNMSAPLVALSFGVVLFDCLCYRTWYRLRSDRRRFRRSSSRLDVQLPRHQDDRWRYGYGRQDLRGCGWYCRHLSRYRLRRNERFLPGRLGLCRGCLG
jgi:cation/acetate symporter